MTEKKQEESTTPVPNPVLGRIIADECERVASGEAPAMPEWAGCSGACRPGSSPKPVKRLPPFNIDGGA